MKLVRASLRSIALVLGTVTLTALWLVTRPLSLFSDHTGRVTHAFWVRSWAKFVTKTLGVRITVNGSAPTPPFFLAVNHLSYLDILVILTCADGFFLAKSEIAGWPIMGPLARMTGTQFVDRSKKSDVVRASARLEELLRNGRGVILFPEGTSTCGEAVEPFKPSLFEPAVRTQTPVTCASLFYATPEDCPPASDAACWWGDRPFFGHFLVLLTLPSVDARLDFGAANVRAGERKQLAALARRGVLAEFQPTTVR